MKPRAWKTPLEFQLGDYRSYRLQTPARWSGPKARVSDCSRPAKIFFSRKRRGQFAAPKEICLFVKAENTVSEI